MSALTAPSARKSTGIEDVRDAAYWWMVDYNEQRSHESLGDLTPTEYR